MINNNLENINYGPGTVLKPLHSALFNAVNNLMIYMHYNSLLPFTKETKMQGVKQFAEGYTVDKCRAWIMQSNWLQESMSLIVDNLDISS